MEKIYFTRCKLICIDYIDNIINGVILLNLVICDDDLKQHDWIKLTIDNWSKKRKEPISVTSYTSAESLLFDKENWSNCDGFILDIEMKNMNGMQLARELRHMDKHVPILFLTGFEDYVFEGYEVGAVSYLLKPINEEKFHLAIDKIYDLSEYNRDFIIIDYKGTCEKIYLSDIVFIESDRHNSIITSLKTQMISSQGINQLNEKLHEKGFFMPHRSFLINIKHIEKITKKSVFLNFGYEVPIARGKWIQMNQSYLDYHRRV